MLDAQEDKHEEKASTKILRPPGRTAKNQCPSPLHLPMWEVMGGEGNSTVHKELRSHCAGLCSRSIPTQVVEDRDYSSVLFFNLFSALEHTKIAQIY